MDNFNPNYPSQPQNFNEIFQSHFVERKKNSDDEISFDDLICQDDLEAPISELEFHIGEVIEDHHQTLENSLNTAIFSTIEENESEGSIKTDSNKLLNTAIMINTASKVKNIQAIHDCLKIETSFSNFKADVNIQDLFRSTLHQFKQNPDMHPMAVISEGTIKIRKGVDVWKNLQDLTTVHYAPIHHEHGYFFISDSLKADHPNIHQYAIEVDEDVGEHIRAKFQEAGFQPQFLVISNGSFNQFKTLATIYFQLKLQLQAQKKEEYTETFKDQTSEKTSQLASKKNKNKKEISDKEKKYFETILIKDDIQKQTAEDVKRKKKIESERIKEKDQKIHEQIRIEKEAHDDVTTEIESQKILKEWKEE